jgi:pimeloyl-ACP methyl ester carboxylesterase
MRQRLGSLTAGLLVACAAAAAAQRGDAIYARPGRLTPAGDGARLSLYCMGAGSPTVVFEGGFTDWAPAWSMVQPKIARFTRACSYDRAGAGFSEPGPMPRTTERIARELHGTLHAAGIDGPYILVGHAFGGDHVRAFADLFLEDVAGLVLVEADASDVESADMRRKDDEGGQAYIARLQACRDGIAAGKDPVLPGRPDQPPRTCSQLFFRGLPERNWSAGLNAKLLEIGRTKTAMWDADISEMRETPADERWLIEHRRSLGDRPVRIITTGNHGVTDLTKRRPTSLAHLKYEYDVAAAQSRWLDLSTDTRQVFTTNSSEYVQFDEPGVVEGVIREVWTTARASQARARRDK